MAHDRKDVRADRSLKTMYIEPIVRIFRENGGRMWKGSDDRLDLVIDLKTDDPSRCRMFFEERLKVN